MVQKKKTFKEDLLEIREFLAQRRQITALAKTLGINRKTVQDALSVDSPSELKGKKIDVVKFARLMKKEIEATLDIDNN